MSDFSEQYRAAIEASLRAFVNNGDEVACIGYYKLAYGQCQMCDHVPIKWHYILENLRTHKPLIVGSECVTNYQTILSEWGYRPDRIIFPSQLKVYARWILAGNPDAVIYDSTPVLKMQVNCGQIVKKVHTGDGNLQHYGYVERVVGHGPERLRFVGETVAACPEEEPLPTFEDRRVCHRCGSSVPSAEISVLPASVYTAWCRACVSKAQLA